MNKQNILNMVIQLTVEKYAEAGRMDDESGVRNIHGSEVDFLIEELQANISEVLNYE